MTVFLEAFAHQFLGGIVFLISKGAMLKQADGKILIFCIYKMTSGIPLELIWQAVRKLQQVAAHPQMQVICVSSPLVSSSF
jgi:hypothetical protein